MWPALLRLIGLGGAEATEATGARAAGALRLGRGTLHTGPRGHAATPVGTATAVESGNWVSTTFGVQSVTSILQSAEGWLPGFTHAISVSVQGGPGSDIRRLWYLCLSAAFGRYRNKATSGVQASYMKCTWDITGKAVNVIIGYKCNNTINGIGNLINPTSTNVFRTGYEVICEGPTQVTVGGNWQFFTNIAGSPTPPGAINDNSSSILGGISSTLLQSLTGPGNSLNNGLGVLPVGRMVTLPCGASTFIVYPIGPTPNSSNDGLLRELLVNTAPGANFVSWRGLGFRLGWDPSSGTLLTSFTNRAPTLPDDGRIITSGTKNDPRVQPPKPPVDGVSRGGVLSLVSQTLQTPCFCVSPPKCVGSEQPILQTGVFVYPPGANQNLAQLQGSLQQFAAAPIYNTTPYEGFFGPGLTVFLGPDGQVLPPILVPRALCNG